MEGVNEFMSMSSKFRPSAKAIQKEIFRLKMQRAKRIRLVCMAVALVVVAGIGLTVVFLARPVQVHGMSMDPTLQPGDVLLMDCVRTLPERGDVVVSNMETMEGLRLVKRVIGLPGDEVTIDEGTGQVVLNGEYVHETYVKQLSYEPCDITFPVVVPDGHVFVLGDNRMTSVDSRSSIVGMVPLNTLEGKVWSSNRKVSP